MPGKYNPQGLFRYDEETRKTYPVIAGLDEAGRGPLAGPVVASAVILSHGIYIDGLRDSKKVPEKQRKELFWHILCSSVDIGIGIVDAPTIDRINILRATMLAMQMAVEELTTSPSMLLIDAVRLPSIPIPQKAIIKGESVSSSIAAASIVAKVVRDSIMTDYHIKYPQYNFHLHKGYPTMSHIETLQRYGPCPIHRMTFRQVRELSLFKT